jgi:hypothetical protein
VELPISVTCTLMTLDLRRRSQGQSLVERVFSAVFQNLHLSYSFSNYYQSPMVDNHIILQLCHTGHMTLKESDFEKEASRKLIREIGSDTICFVSLLPFVLHLIALLPYHQKSYHREYAYVRFDRRTDADRHIGTEQYLSEMHRARICQPPRAPDRDF